MTTTYPQILVDLALAAKNGDESAYAPLHDALCEAGYPLTAGYHFKDGKKCPIAADVCAVIRRLLDLEHGTNLENEEKGHRNNQR